MRSRILWPYLKCRTLTLVVIEAPAVLARHFDKGRAVLLRNRTDQGPAQHETGTLLVKHPSGIIYRYVYVIHVGANLYLYIQIHIYVYRCGYMYT